MEKIELGKSGIAISPIGLGTWQWGDRVLWGYGRGYVDADLKAGFDAALESGVNLIDTAEVYGSGKSESLLGRLALCAGRDVVVASKFMPYPWRVSRSRLLMALRRSLARLGRERIELN